MNFLDITLDLRNNTYELNRNEPYQTLILSTSIKTLTIEKNFLRELTKSISISKRLCDLSSNKQTFEKATQLYCEALKKIGFNGALVLTPKTNTSNNTNKNNGNAI